MLDTYFAWPRNRDERLKVKYFVPREKDSGFPFTWPESFKKNPISKSWGKNSLFRYAWKKNRIRINIIPTIEYYLLIEKLNPVVVVYQSRTKKKKEIEIFPTFSGPLWFQFFHHEYRGAINRAEFQL